MGQGALCWLYSACAPCPWTRTVLASTDESPPQQLRVTGMPCGQGSQRPLAVTALTSALHPHHNSRTVLEGSPALEVRVVCPSPLLSLPIETIPVPKNVVFCSADDGVDGAHGPQGWSAAAHNATAEGISGVCWSCRPPFRPEKARVNLRSRSQNRVTAGRPGPFLPS